MFCLAINQEDGAVYVGIDKHQLHLVQPRPLLLPLKFEGAEKDPWENTGFREAPRRVFVEDYFDPVTRVRRGRVYLINGTIPGIAQVVNLQKEGQLQGITAFNYQRESLHSLDAFKGAKYPNVILGGESFKSVWKVTGIEQDTSESFVLYLKSFRSLGETPDLIRTEIPPETIAQLEERLEHVENSVNRETPINVVDRCRDAASLVMSRLAECPQKDLAKALNEFKKQPIGEKKFLVHNMVDTLCKLHARGKPNEEHNFGTLPLREEDAQLAVRALGLILREVGWAY